MILKKIRDHFEKGPSTEKDNDFLNLITRFHESTPIGHSNDKLDDNRRISEVVNWAKDKGYLDDIEISEANANILLRSFLVERDLPKELIKNDKLRNELTQVIAKRADNRSPVRLEEAKQGLDLILTGELFGDVSYSISVIIALVARPDRFLNSKENLKGLIYGLIKLPRAIASDLNPKDFSERLAHQISQIKTTQSIDSPEILNNTLAAVFALPEIGDAIETANALLDDQNKSLRLALLIYARLNGINLEQKDIDEVRGTILNRENPDLGALLLYLADKDNLSRLIL